MCAVFRLLFVRSSFAYCFQKLTLKKCNLRESNTGHWTSGLRILPLRYWRHEIQVPRLIIYLANTANVEIDEKKLLAGPGFEPPTPRSEVQPPNHCAIEDTEVQYTIDTMLKISTSGIQTLQKRSNINTLVGILRGKVHIVKNS
jgi:hypothetical protein